MTWTTICMNKNRYDKRITNVLNIQLLPLAAFASGHDELEWC